jgi:hypothetical protein
MSDPLWSQVPPSLGGQLAGQLDRITDDVIAAVRAEVPLYGRPLEGAFGAGVRAGVGQSLQEFCRLVGSSGDAGQDAMSMYEALGASEHAAGRPLDALLSAYRVGARVAWRRFAEVATGAGLSSAALVALAELVFAYIDRLSAASAHGYAVEQALRVGERNRLRADLVRLLLSPLPDPDVVAPAAATAGWPVPEVARAVTGPADVLHTRLGPAALLGADSDPLAVVPADPVVPGVDPLAELRRQLAGTPAVIGPAVPLLQLARSAARARTVAEIARTGALLSPDGDGPLLADDHLAEIVLSADRRAAEDLAAALLAPLDRLPAETAVRLEDTLRAWLCHAGERKQAAAALLIHPQTVHYRMGRIRELLGDLVDDPARRFGLLLALHARVLRRGAEAPDAQRPALPGTPAA